MIFEDESYARLYTRKTLTNRRLQWVGRAVMQAMLGGEEFDRAGVFAYQGDPAECISIVTEIPIDLVRVGLERLVATGTWIVTPDAVVWPTFHYAQTCARSDKIRQAQSRERRANEAARGAAPRPRKRPTSRAVTTGHAPSRASRNVTPILASTDLPLLDPDRARAREPDPGPPEGEPPEPEPELAPVGEASTAELVTRFPKGWRGWSPATVSAAALEGLTVADLAEHVSYWALHHWGSPVHVADLDDELRRQIPNIKARLVRDRATGQGAPTASDRYAWYPDQAARDYATKRSLDLSLAAAAYRNAGTPERLGSLLAHDDFLNRLKCWHATGEFIPSGRLPRAPSRARGAA